MHMRWNSMCSSFEAFLRVLSACACSVVRSGSSSSSQFPPPIPFLLPLFIQCDGCLFPFPVWGLMAWLPGFSSHERGLHLGAGCQWWKFLVFQAPNLQLATQLLTWITRLQVYLFQHSATSYLLLKAPYGLDPYELAWLIQTGLFIVNNHFHSLIVHFIRWIWSFLCNRAQHFMHIMTLSLQKMTGRVYGCCVIVLKSKTQWKLAVLVLALSLFFIWQVSRLNCYVLRP